MNRITTNDKNVAFGLNARSKVQEGINIVANAVGATLGARGRNALIQINKIPMVTKDGITVAKHIQLPDPIMDMGAALIQQVSKRANDEAGDGTTTATVIAQSLINEGIRELSYGADAQSIRRGLEQSMVTVIEGLKEVSQEVTDLEAVATISANDPAIGKTIADMMAQLGEYGVIQLDESQTTETETEIVSGMHWRGGWMSPYLVTDVGTMKAEYDNAPVLITDENPTLQQVVRIVEKVIASGSNSLIIVANHLDDALLRTLAVNKSKGTFHCLPVRKPKYGTVGKSMLEDMAVMTNGTYVGKEGKVSLDKVELEHLGKADKIIAEEKYTTLTGSGDCTKRIEELKTLLKNTKKKHDRGLIEERLSNLAGGIGIIRVGAITEADKKEKLYRVEDALNATKSAREEGIVAGGGVTLYQLRANISEPLENAEEDIGRRIMHKALSAPIIRILENAGAEVRSIQKQLTGKNGYNVKTMQFEQDMVKAGIIDPTKVTRIALEAATSIAIMVLTTEVSITDIKEENVQD